MSTGTYVWAIALCFSCVTAVGCSASAENDEVGEVSAAQTKGGSESPVGKACHVVSGGNKGQSGTYTNDVDGLNCAGSWGSTNCCDQQGKDNGNCKAGARVVVPPVWGGPVPPVLAHP